MSLQAVFNSIIVKPQDEEEITYGSIVVTVETYDSNS